jgi:hypothetical protein
MLTNPNVGTYDIRKLIVTLGPVLITGWADGESFNITQPEDSFEIQRGADGQVERYAKNVSDAEITLTLLPSSLSNEGLTALHATDKATGLGKVPFLMKDLNSVTTLASFLFAWITKNPDMSAGNTAVQREWTINTGPGFWLVGANIL